MSLPQNPSPAKTLLYDAQCSNCKKWTKVVFPPDGVRLVYCKSCRKKLKRGRTETGEKKIEVTPSSLSLTEALKTPPTYFYPGKVREETTFKKRKTVDQEELKKALQEFLKKKENKDLNK